MAVLTNVSRANFNFTDLNNQTVTELVNETLPQSIFNQSYKLCGNESFINQELLGLNGNFSLKQLTLDSECKQVTLSLDIGSFPVGEQIGKVVAVGSNFSKELRIKLRVINTDVWNFTNNSLNVELPLRSFKAVFIGFVNRRNFSVQLNFTLQDAANVSLFDTQGIVLAPSTSVEKPFYLSTFNTSAGLKVVNITANDSVFSRVFTINLTVIDSKSPEILSIENQEFVKLNELAFIRVKVLDESQIASVKLFGFNNSFIADFRVFNDTHWEGQFRNTTSSGAKQLMLEVSDIWNNTASKNFTLDVVGINNFLVSSDIKLGKSRYLNVRNITVGKMLVASPISFKLDYLVLDRVLNSSINVSINGKQIAPNSTLSFPSLSGDIILSVAQNPVYYYYFNNSKVAYSDRQFPNYTQSYDPVDYLVRFDGQLQVIPDPTSEMNASAMLFAGEFGMYSVTLPSVTKIPYLNRNTQQLNLLNFSCDPNDVFVYENSTYNCGIAFPIDAEATEMSLITSLSSYRNLIDGYERNLTFTTSERDTANLRSSILFLFLFVGVVVWFAKYKVWEKVHYH